MIFKKTNKLIDEMALNILQKRYFASGESCWEDVVDRVIYHVFPNEESALVGDKYETIQMIKEMMYYRYFIPNSPTLVNAGKLNGGLSACYVVDMKDSIEDIYKTKLDFALIARKGGGCGTTLSKLRPEGSSVSGSTHGYAGGPIKFGNTISHDMDALTQAGFRDMAMLFSMSIRHPDIMKFIKAKTTEGTMSNVNISVMVDDAFMESVKKNETYWTEFNGEKVKELNAKEVFDEIVLGAWKNGEPGILFYNKINSHTPYIYTGEEILSTNPCGELPAPPNSVCNLGSIDISKFMKEDKTLDLWLLENAVRLSVIFLDAVIEINKLPNIDIELWSMEHRPIGLGIMGFADLLLNMDIAYGSKTSVELLEFIMNFIYNIAEDESIELGIKEGFPAACKLFPVPRKNFTLLAIAPTGTISLLAGCSSGIEPIFSEITIREDKTGRYQMNADGYDKPCFRCAVSANGAKEVTWQEHLAIQNVAQHFVDSGVSKTINFPNHTHKETIGEAFMEAWMSPYIKGLTVYRNGSRSVEVLSPKNVKSNKCPLCGAELVHESGCVHCSKCDYQLCNIS